MWRDAPHLPLKEYHYTVVTWGTASASFNAARALRQCALDEKDSLPIGAQVVQNNFYMDDLLTGADNEDELITSYRETCELLKRGGFTLAKFITNSKKLASQINQLQNAEMSFPVESGLLGMRWLPKTDQLRLKMLQPPGDVDKLTKRFIVSRVSQIFDPSGVVAPILIGGKMLIQELWRAGVDWDEELSNEVRCINGKNFAIP